MLNPVAKIWIHLIEAALKKEKFDRCYIHIIIITH